MKTENYIVDEALSIVSFYENDKTHPLDNISEVYQFLIEPNTVRDEYKRYLTKRNKKGKPITTRGIDWKDIIEIYNQKFEELWNKIGLPQNTDGYTSIKEFYLVDVLSMIKEQLFENIYEMANFKIHSASTTHTPEDAKNILSSQIEKMLEPILRMRELISISLEEDPNTINKLISESSTLSKIIKKGKKFKGGRKQRKEEVEVFELIIEDYKKQHNNGYNFSWKTITDKFAPFEKFDDLQNFYRRFMEYNKKK